VDGWISKTDIGTITPRNFSLNIKYNNMAIDEDNRKDPSSVRRLKVWKKS